ncbi:MAG TPA: GPW/gp25 family protein [Thermoanaerobaculia bacterium]
MSAGFLGIGWKLPVSLEGGRIAMAEYEESIRESIWIILATARGERKMRPDFGCGIHDLIFAVHGGETSGRVASEVRQALILWEPRIDLLDVSVRADEAEPTRLLIQIEYRVRATNNRFNLVYPFYME